VKTIAERLEGFDRAITTEELATIWDMKPWTIREWIRNKRLPAHRLGNEWKIDPIEALIYWQSVKVGR
jgi:excisionase family DNA binding protein